MKSGTEKGKGKIVWLASYPKSGNTWFRAFLTALFNPEKATVDINDLYPATIASNRQLFDEIAGLSSSDLYPDEIDRLRPFVYRQNAIESAEIVFQKVHDAFTFLPDGEPLFPADITKSVLYFIRNPLDVAVSFSHHLSTSMDKTISIMNNSEYAFCQNTDRLPNQLRQKLLTWSGHVKSWVDNSGMPLHVMRFEDMKAYPVETFAQAVRFLGLTHSLSEIAIAMEKSSFDKLKQQEEEKGFSEKSYKSNIFFRKGMSGEWSNLLSKEQVDRMVKEHGKMMLRFGYLDKNKC